MKAITQDRYGGPELLSIDDVDRPVCGNDQVLIEVRAAGLSPGDRAYFSGVPYINRLAASGLRQPKAPIPGYDVAGIVEAVGRSVTRFEAGDEVFGNAPGSFAEFVVAAEDQLAHKPDSWSFEQAAAVPESGGVAIQAVCDRGQVQKDHRVAIIGASGGVGSYAVQIAKSQGAHVTGVCGPTKVDSVTAIGADAVIDYTRHDLTKTRHHYDVIIDTAAKTPLRQLRRALTDQGRLVIVGANHDHRVTGGLGRWLRALLWSPFVSQTLRPFAAKPLTHAYLEDLRDLMENGDVVPVVDRAFTMDEAADAFRYLDHRAGTGKVVLLA